MTHIRANMTRDGIAFHVQGWVPENAPRAVFGLVHGLGEHTGRYEHVGEALTGAGFALVGFDLRGHGKTNGARGHFPSLDAAMQDIRQFVTFLGDRFSGAPIFLYGHSLGGLLALAYAIQYGAGLSGVIATGPALRSALQKQKAKVAMARILGSLVPGITIPSGLVATGISRDSAVVKKFENDRLVHRSASLGLGNAALAAIDMCFARASELALPLLIMHGAADPITYPDGSEDFARLAGENNRDVTLKLWDGLFHEIHNEAEKAEVFRTMIEWADRHLLPSRTAGIG